MTQVDTSKLTRVELIDESGRVYVNADCKDVKLLEQDQGRTLKIVLRNARPGTE